MRVTGILADRGFHAFDHESRVHAGHNIPRIWFLVADQEKAYIYRRAGHGLEQIAHIEPRFSGSHQHHQKHSHHQEKHGLEHEFCRMLAEWCDEARNEDAFDRLVLVAGARIIGDIRDEIPDTLRPYISAEIQKDLTKHGIKDLEKALDKGLCF
jgi:protein required for attachment to host cells